MHARKTFRTIALGATTLALTVPALGGVAVAATERTVITEADITRQAEDTPPTDEWVFYSRLAGNGAFRPGPATPPLGSGSFEFTTPTGNDKATLFNYEHVDADLDTITAMGYSTYRSQGSDPQVAAINIQVDANGTATPGGFTTLVFEPVYNTAQQTLASNVWQDWDAYKGGQAIWWSSSPIPGAPNRDTFVPWNTILAANSDAVIVGGYGLNQGSGNPALVTATDALRLSHGDVDVTYDFEVDPLPPTDKDQCKDGGYQEFSNPSFKNQGECVSYVQHSENGSDGEAAGASSVPSAKLAALSLLS